MFQEIDDEEIKIRKKYIDEKYNHYKVVLYDTLKIKEEMIHLMKIPVRKLKGALWGAIDGFLTGMALGGKWGNGGGMLMGGINQLLCTFFICPCQGMVVGAICGFLSNSEEIGSLLSDYRQSLGSTTDQKVKTNIFPGYKVPNYISNED